MTGAILLLEILFKVLLRLITVPMPVKQRESSAQNLLTAFKAWQAAYYFRAVIATGSSEPVLQEIVLYKGQGTFKTEETLVLLQHYCLV